HNMPSLDTAAGNAGFEASGAIRHVRHRQHDRRYGKEHRYPDHAAEDEHPFVPTVHPPVAKSKVKYYRLCTSFSSSPMIASPISLVLTILQPSHLMSAVRKPLASAAAIA